MQMRHSTANLMQHSVATMHQSIALYALQAIRLNALSAVWATLFKLASASRTRFSKLKKLYLPNWYSVMSLFSWVTL